MLLRANNFRKDKESDCRRNELESRIFVGRVFVDYAECLHFYPSFSYGRIIARRKEENLCLHEDIISSRICALITAKKRREEKSSHTAEPNAA